MPALLPGVKPTGRRVTIPFVVVDPEGEPPPGVASVGATNWNGGLAATRHLLELGHRRIGMIGGPADMLCSRARVDGYRAALETAGIAVDAVVVEPWGAHPSYAQGYYDRDNAFYVGWEPISRDPAALAAYLDEYVYGAVRAGASGFLLKDVSPDNLVHAVREVARGDTILDPVLTRRLLERFASGPVPGELPPELGALTERETEVLRLALDGATVAAVAGRLHLSPGTVRNHLSAAIGKTGTRTRVEAARVARERGWL